ncbi:MAG: CvpA family protein [Gammaproteobacteria bacterium]
MSGIDTIILICLFLPALIGLVYGFLNILFSIVAWVLALAIAVKFCGYVAPLLDNYVGLLLLRELLAFIGLFIISLMLLSTLGYFIVKLLARAGLTAADRMLGFVFGFGLGGVIVWGMVFLAGFTPLTEKDWWQESLLIWPFQQIAIWAEQFLPIEMVSYHGYGKAV